MLLNFYNMKFLFLLLSFCLYINLSNVNAKDTPKTGPSYTKELVSIPSLDAITFLPVLPLSGQTTIVAKPTTTSPLNKVVQSVKNKKMSLLQTLNLIRKMKVAKKQAPAQAYVGNGDALAVASLITGVGGLILVLLPYIGWLALAACICGIVFGVMAKKRGTSKRGMATAGIICGIIGCALFVLWLTDIVILFRV